MKRSSKQSLPHANGQVLKARCWQSYVRLFSLVNAIRNPVQHYLSIVLSVPSGSTFVQQAEKVPLRQIARAVDQKMGSD